MLHEMPLLPYGKAELSPKMSEETMEFHYGKHLQTYVDNLNKLIQGTPFESMTLEDIVRKSEGSVLNNAAQVWNHTFFFRSLTPKPKPMSSQLKTLLERNFGSLENFRVQFEKAATTLFGSGWVWLVRNSQNEMMIVSEGNAGNPMRDGLTPVLVIDVWEHAYYIDYRNRRAEYIKAVWDLIDWEVVADRCAHKRWTSMTCFFW